MILYIMIIIIVIYRISVHVDFLLFVELLQINVFENTCHFLAIIIWFFIILSTHRLKMPLFE